MWYLEYNVFGKRWQASNHQDFMKVSVLMSLVPGAFERLLNEGKLTGATSVEQEIAEMGLFSKGDPRLYTYQIEDIPQEDILRKTVARVE